MINRREFIGATAMAGAGTVLPGCCSTGCKAKTPHPDFMWADLVHLGINSWRDGYPDGKPSDDFRVHLRVAQPYMRTDEQEWKFCVDGLAAAGCNTLVIDVAEGIQYQSHPELAVKGSWSIEKFRAELDRIRRLGMEPIPKLNFSTAHDTWLGIYHRMVSTKKYYQVCSDLIREVYEVFDKPRYFHLGYDEETPEHQAKYIFAVIRQGDLWWHDFLWFNKQVEDLGARTWIWADYIWKHREEFEKRMPRSVLMSNWYYAREFDVSKIENEFTKKRVLSYEWLDKAGFDQVPCGSNCAKMGTAENMTHTVRHCMDKLDPNKLKGFLLAPWSRQVPEYHFQNVGANAAMADGIRVYNEILAKRKG